MNELTISKVMAEIDANFNWELCQAAAITPHQVTKSQADTDQDARLVSEFFTPEEAKCETSY